ncbi:MAG: hypothetical protein ACK42I_10660, partial [Thermomicrobium sp.]
PPARFRRTRLSVADHKHIPGPVMIAVEELAVTDSRSNTGRLYRSSRPTAFALAYEPASKTGSQLGERFWR